MDVAENSGAVAQFGHNDKGCPVALRETAAVRGDRAKVLESHLTILDRTDPRGVGGGAVRIEMLGSQAGKGTLVGLDATTWC